MCVCVCVFVFFQDLDLLNHTEFKTLYKEYFVKVALISSLESVLEYIPNTSITQQQYRGNRMVLVKTDLEPVLVTV